MAVESTRIVPETAVAQAAGSRATPPADATADDWNRPVRTTPGASRAEDGEPALVVDVDGFEGPLDLLLNLARAQKVDLARISILALAEQYLAFVEAARATRLELAADYLVMAAWLAYLKSRLLLPSPPSDDQPSGEELAAALAFRLQRLEAMRAAAGALMERQRLGREVFARGRPEAVSVERQDVWQASLYDLLTAYAGLRQRQMVTTVRVARRQVWALADARVILERLVGRIADWTPIVTFLGAYLSPEMRATVIASSFSASLELVREGKLEIRQAEAFEPLYIRTPATPRAEPAGGSE
ncbi:segregation and condensation protein A [Prosthecomicrobium hirschii]|uniref:segregation and condensation protein A n=1 Tax=Prosthecodimorpha hirschii TaxID=665126 RepID=UPI0009F9AB99|nr:ScpA family protein [Prosthecomicrobium hirschii]